MIINTYCRYKYAPETAGATVNGLKMDLSNTMIQQHIATGHKAEAEKELKKLYRKEISKENKYIYAFFLHNSNQFYYISCLNFTAKDDIKTRLHCYKELKHHLQNNPPEIVPEIGHFIPGTETKPETIKQNVNINFSKCKKIRIIGV